MRIGNIEISVRREKVTSIPTDRWRLVLTAQGHPYGVETEVTAAELRELGAHLITEANRHAVAPARRAHAKRRTA